MTTKHVPLALLLLICLCNYDDNMRQHAVRRFNATNSTKAHPNTQLLNKRFSIPQAAVNKLIYRIPRIEQ